MNDFPSENKDDQARSSAFHRKDSHFENLGVAHRC